METWIIYPQNLCDHFTWSYFIPYLKDSIVFCLVDMRNVLHLVLDQVRSSPCVAAGFEFRVRPFLCVLLALQHWRGEYRCYDKSWWPRWCRLNWRQTSRETCLLKFQLEDTITRGCRKSKPRRHQLLPSLPWYSTAWRSTFEQVHRCTIYSTRQKAHKASGLVVVDVRGVHTKEGPEKCVVWCVQRERVRERDGVSGGSLLLFTSFISTRASPSHGDVSLGFCWACQLVPLWSLLYMLYSIWTAGPGRGERGSRTKPKLCPAFKHRIVVSQRKTN